MSEFKSIPSNLFAGKSSIISAVCGSMCSSIGNNAFKECISFEKINDDNVIEEIGYGAFYNTKLSSAIFSTLTKINETKDEDYKGAFENCKNLTNINIENCLDIPYRTFYNCTTLSSIYTTSCQSVGSFAFYACKSLSEIDLKSCNSIGNSAFAYCNNLSSIDATSCQSVGSYAFLSCKSLYEIDLKSCKRIGSYAFYSCTNLTSINFDNECVIGDYAFYGLKNLKNITFSKCKTIGNYAFFSCKTIENVYLHNCRIGVGAFAMCENLKELTIKDGYIGNSLLFGIANSAFFYCKNLQTVNIISTDPNSEPIRIGSNVFYSGNSIRFYLSSEQIEKYKVASNWSNYASNMHVLASENQIIYTTNNNEIIYISDDMLDDLGISNHTYNEDYGIIEFDTDNKNKILNKQLFRDNKNLTSIQIPPCCTEIGESEFSGCTRLNSVIMPMYNPKLEKIGKYAFENCGIKSFTIPDTITEIGEGAFNGCTAIESFKGNENFVKYDNKAIISNDTLICFLPSNNSKICNISDIDNNIKILGEYCFQNCNKLIRVNIPSTIQSIHKFAFDNCTDIIEVNFNSFIPPLIEETSFGVWVYDNSNDKYIQSERYNFNLLHLFVPENTFVSYFKQYKEEEYWFCNNFYIKPIFFFFILFKI